MLHERQQRQIDSKIKDSIRPWLQDFQTGTDAGEEEDDSEGENEDEVHEKNEDLLLTEDDGDYYDCSGGQQQQKPHVDEVEGDLRLLGDWRDSIENSVGTDSWSFLPDSFRSSLPKMIHSLSCCSVGLTSLSWGPEGILLPSACWSVDLLNYSDEEEMNYDYYCCCWVQVRERDDFQVPVGHVNSDGKDSTDYWMYWMIDVRLVNLNPSKDSMAHPFLIFVWSIINWLIVTIENK